jgi:hypothetical protein
VSILQSGCQTHFNGSILHFNEKRLFYAATLAVYIIDSRTFVIEKV